MYDPIRQRFRFRCPEARRPVEARLSSFRTVERLAGPEHPAVYRIGFRCPLCRQEHVGLASEHELDCHALQPPGDMVFLNLQTGRVEPLARELEDTAQRELGRGNWPWTFYCAGEHRVRPGYPSRLAMLAPTDDARLVGVAVGCAACAHVSINLVSDRHLDQPFFHDRVVRFVDRTFDDALDSFERFCEDLWSSRFDEERNDFAA